MASVEEDIKDLLELSLDLDLQFTKNLFIGILPDTPINATALITSAGRMSQDNNDIEYDYFFLEVTTRNTNYSKASTLLQNIKSYLTRLTNTKVGDATYIAINCFTPPYLLAYSENNQPIFSMILELQRELIIL